MTTPDDPTRELLAGLAPAPLSPAERMDAASARLRKAAATPHWSDYAKRNTLGSLAAALSSEAGLHRHPAGRCQEQRRGRPCVMTAIADAVLGNEVTR